MALTFVAGLVITICLPLAVFYVLLTITWTFRKIFIFFIAALVADILSTIYFVHILGLGWSAEMNYLVNKYGDSVGQLNALLINHSILATFGYGSGLFLNKLSESLNLFVFGSSILFLTGVVLHNTVIPTIAVLIQ